MHSNIGECFLDDVVIVHNVLFSWMLVYIIFVFCSVNRVVIYLLYR